VNEEAVVVDVPDASRYELRLGDRVLGFSEYRKRPGRISFLHTEIDESSGGRGYGIRLAAGATEDARRQGLKIVPICPFIRRYLEMRPVKG
jgi:hypothetical protein